MDESTLDLGGLVALIPLVFTLYLKAFMYTHGVAILDTRVNGQKLGKAERTARRPIKPPVILGSRTRL